jgi:N-acetylglutamate synthase-like GNAT family acetyltransferase
MKPMEVDATQTLVRSAQPTDAAAIARLVNAWAEAGLTLPRTIASIEQSVGEFVVVARGARIMAAGALEVHSPSIAEIRSVAVDPDAKGLGAGRDIVEFLLEQAVTLDVEEVTLLTKVPGFFAKFGFRVVSPDELPPSFMEEAISARGRTLIGRQIMARYVSAGVG